MSSISTLHQAQTRRRRNMGHGTASPRVTVAHLLRAATRTTGWPVDEIVGPSRERRVTELRHALFWVATRRLGISTMIVAPMFGRDHSTVCHGRDQIAARLDEPQIARMLEGIETVARRIAADQVAS